MVRDGWGLLLMGGLVFAPSCAVWHGANQPLTERALQVQAQAKPVNDAVWKGLLSGDEVPRTVSAVRARLLSLGGRLETHIVANRGHENPEAGSFSFFETYTGPIPGGSVKEGEFFLGFFSQRQGDALSVQQSFDPGLMIEVIAWDYDKQQFNFWELTGTGRTADWHYRGDTDDILADVAQIGVGAPSPKFGSRLRCSGCHTLGGPIMKELDAPNNDWWTTRRQLMLGSLTLERGSDPRNSKHLAAALFAGASDASNLSRHVEAGMARLAANPRPQGLKHRLRSLFDTMEINLASDTQPLKERSGGFIELPRSFFVDERLAGNPSPIRVSTESYRNALRSVGSRFAPDEAPGLPESHHAFVVPVRSRMDQLVIERLIGEGILDAELVADVLAIDFTTPVYSRARAKLLRYVPEHAANAADLRQKLMSALAEARQDGPAQELLANLRDPRRTAQFHRQQANAYLATCEQVAETRIVDWLRLASQRRAEIDAAETALNPRGRITEPGFRVIFPVDEVQARPGAYRINPRNGGLEPVSLSAGERR